jgi:hypothetical protein
VFGRRRQRIASEPGHVLNGRIPLREWMSENQTIAAVSVRGHSNLPAKVEIAALSRSSGRFIGSATSSLRGDDL